MLFENWVLLKYWIVMITSYKPLVRLTACISMSTVNRVWYSFILFSAIIIDLSFCNELCCCMDTMSQAHRLCSHNRFYASLQWRLLTLNSLTWRIRWAPNNASRWQMGFQSAFKGLNAAISRLNLMDCLLAFFVNMQNIVHSPSDI